MKIINSQKRYKYLISKLNFILKYHQNNIILLSINWLFLIKEHHVILKKYNILFQKRKIGFKFYFLRLLKKYILLLLYNFYLIILPKFKKTKFKKNDKNIIILSHYIQNKTSDKYDFYFGNLNFYNKNINIYRFLFMPTLINFNINKISDKKNIKNFVLNTNLGFFKNLSLVYSLIKESNDFYKISKNKFGINKKIYKLLSLEALSLSTFKNLAFYHQISYFLEVNNIDSIISTYEGQSFERLIFLSAKNSNKNIKTIGYKHVPYTKLQNTPILDLGTNLNPDFIYSIGDNCFKNKIYNFDYKQKILGSVKYKKNLKNLSKENLSNKTILLLPEGLLSETYEFLNLAVRCSKILKDYTFILRTHPVINIKYLFKEKYNKKIFKNIIFSNKDIDEDILNSNFAIYRGSSAIIQAINGGTYPIYMPTDDNLLLDPLFNISDYVYEINDLNNFCQFIINSDYKKFYDNKNYKYIKNFCSNFYRPYNYSLF